MKDLKTTNPIRLGLALNFSVFKYEVIKEPFKAIKHAKEAFESAINDIEELSESDYDDTILIL